MSRRLTNPTWLSPLVEALQHAASVQTFQVVNVPPQYGKTETIMHWLALHIGRRPDLNNAYVTYETKLAHRKSRKIRRYALAAGAQLDRTQCTQENWRTTSEGGLQATGIGGALTGEPVDGILVIDDPIKNREEANSLTIRDKVWDWVSDVAINRMHPGASLVLNMTRWHPDDPAGRAKDAGWDVVVIRPVVNPTWDGHDFTAGESIWPTRTLEFLSDKRRRLGEYTWSAMWDQNPRHKGGQVFEGPTFAQMPDAYRTAIGLDMAYTAKTYADYSVTLVGHRERGTDRIHISHMDRRQVRAEDRIPHLKSMAIAHPGAPLWWYYGGQEETVASLMHGLGAPRITAIKATGDKLLRAEHAAAAWNRGDITLPEGAPWVPEMVRELEAFTGIRDKHDDIADALAALYDALQGDGGGVLVSGNQLRGGRRLKDAR